MKMYNIVLCLIVLFFSYCKENKGNSVENKESFFYEMEIGCYTHSEISNECLTKIEELGCYKTLNELRRSKLGEIFFNKTWVGEDQQTLFYIIDSKGDIRIFQGGPDKEPNQRSLIGKGKIYSEQNNWYYEQKCIEQECESFRIPILYLYCAITSDLVDKDVLRKIEFGNRKLVESDEISNNNKYKSILFIEEQPIKNQIFNGFISTKVPPILEKR
ncbi:hypothetical protein CH354_00365 [Leptospira levettii]|uniref:hypothetical protein n=1 Tax=Leptospira levettii TaxID=2023178 RepID=UPI000C2AC30A|nr:hypothetical protein [Leptospira levettii]MCW7473342.1 hypothetical protein [Leptospira levettii]PJZ37759.1 hypothetical protein CH354_00365 [Leptospira levettii]PJZ90392.1 hypothetical protein CH368_01395 [Leptospira levettii]PKA01490.1 hypothetical protein CH369_06955 [Leptospira levettii]